MSSWPIDPADYVAGLLDADETRRAEELLRDDAEFRAQVERLRQVVARLERLPDDAWDAPPAPPAFDRSMFLGPVVATQPRRRRRPMLFFPAAGLITAAVAALVVWVGGDDAATRTVTLDALGGTGGTVQIAIDGDTATLIADHIPTTDSHHHYEAWIGDRSGHMVSMGTFRVDGTGTATVSMPVQVDLADYGVIDVSLEEDDGNPAHSTHSVFRGTL